MVSFLSAAPDKVLDSIFVFCDYGELFASSHVCTSWRRRAGTSVLWRRVSQQDLERARDTEYQIVATPVQKRAELSSSFSIAHLYTVEVRTRQRQHHSLDSAEYGDGSGEYGHSSSANNAVPAYAQNLQMYAFGAEPTSTIASAYGRGRVGELECNPSSTCFTTLGSTAKVRRVCMRYIQPLRFTAGDAVAAELQRANRKNANAAASTSTDEDGDAREKALPLWEDGSILRPGVLLCDPQDPCTFCYYAATLSRPWCTVLMDRFVIDDALLVDFIEHSRNACGSGSGDAVTCIDLAFRVEELPVVRNDPRDPSHLIKPAQPVSIRIGVVEESHLDAYRRGLLRVIRSVQFYSRAEAEGADTDSDASANSEVNDVYGHTAAQDYAWGALDAGYSHNTGARRDGGGVTWSYTGGGGTTFNHDDDDASSAAAAEAEVTAWLQASVQESTQRSNDHGGSPKNSASSVAVSSTPLEFWAQTPDTRPAKPAVVSAADPCTRHSGAARVRRTSDAEVQDDHGGCAYVLGDTPGSFGYDTEGCYISEASSYPLGAPLQRGDVVHLQFFHDEDVIVVTRNRERLGTLVADAFSERQRWCVAVSLQNCGVRFIPPRLN